MSDEGSLILISFRPITIQKPYTLGSKITLISIWYRMVLTQILTWVYKYSLTLRYPPNTNIQMYSNYDTHWKVLQYFVNENNRFLELPIYWSNICVLDQYICEYMLLAIKIDNGNKEPTRGYTSHNSNSILILSGYVKTRRSL